MTTRQRYDDAVARHKADSTDGRAKMEIFITSGIMLDRGECGHLPLEVKKSKPTTYSRVDGRWVENK
jgi:hypothetical protein